MTDSFDPASGKPKVIEMFSTERTVLMREVNKHPALVSALSSYDKSDFPNMLAEISTYCGIVVDGMYSPAQLDKMCGVLYWELRGKRVVRVH